METWKIITNVILTVIILALTVVVIIDYIKHKDDESISAEDLKQLRKSHFIFAMLVAIGLLYSHICRFFIWQILISILETYSAIIIYMQEQFQQCHCSCFFVIPIGFYQNSNKSYCFSIKGYIFAYRKTINTYWLWKRTLSNQ